MKIFQTLRNHPGIIPVFVITVVGASFAGLAILRSANVYTDVSFRRKSNPHPWLSVKPEENFKFIKAVDYGKVEQDKRPNYEK